MKVYVGARDGSWSVHIHEHGDTRALPAPGATNPEDPGFRWGYDGPGPRFLAQCIVVDAMGFGISEDGQALTYHSDDVPVAALAGAAEVVLQALKKARGDWFQVTEREVHHAFRKAKKRKTRTLVQAKAEAIFAGGIEVKTREQ